MNTFQLIILSIFVLILFYKYSFWLYTIQLKEYRWDRFKEYLFTKQGKKAVFNFWFYFELVIIILLIWNLISFLNYIPPKDSMRFDGLSFLLIPYLLLLFLIAIEGIFVFCKLVTKKFILPKATGRTILITTITFLIFFLVFPIMFFDYLNVVELFFPIYLVLLLITPYLFLFLSNLLTLSLVNYKKNKIIFNAEGKSKKINNPIKIAITGSYGKSSVKEFLACILEKEGKTLKTPENINTELGVSDIVLKKLDDTYKYFIAEVGAYRVGEIETLGKIVNHKYGFITAIGNQHIGLFGNQENILKGKTELAIKVRENNGILYINADNKYLNEYDFDENINIVKYGQENKEADAFSENIKIEKGLTSFDFNYKGKKNSFITNLIGKHNILNITGVIAFCIDMGIKIENIKKYLLEIKVPTDTLEITNKESIKVINDTHNLSEDGLLGGIEVLNSFKGKRVLVMDDILELGKDGKKIHFNIGKKLAEDNLIDMILFCGVNYKKEIINGLIEGGFNKENIINSLDEIKNNTNILFEGKKAKQHINKVK